MLVFAVRRSSMMILLPFFMAMTLNLFAADGYTYVVGDGDGWNLYANFTNWTQGKDFHVGDILEFNYDSALHNVMQVNSTAYEDCIKVPYVSLLTSGNDSVILSEIGQIWYICGVEDHCESGQKLSINVTS